MSERYTLVAQPLQSDTEVLGYKLIDRIGSGGFGEVWSAEAPGGLMKALKIVYGFHDEKRAQSELKALSRIKMLRHPFLLNLERIEIYEGQLVVVTELADMSMADLFNEHVAKGEPGIPRENILRYIRDSGDALDYIAREQRLQHLDVKPENLLMVSGHVKVADFGLIKDLKNASQSLMQGMTPAYAAPELFDGRPGDRSDQYSLAIVYQEMLTGSRPFSGSTPAQLAAQHMHGKPNLQLLPKDDQIVIAKALAKDPAHRFASCREMAEELMSKRRVNRKVSRVRATRSDSDTDPGTMALDATNDFTAILSNNGLPYRAAEIQAIEPPVCDESTAKFTPTLVIGVGNMANRIVHKLKQQLEIRHGNLESLKSFKMLCIDSNHNDLADISRSGEVGSMTLDETIPIPIRKPESYRDSSARFSWLSRRWLYNIPRTLQTEGLRPLGRLVFVDHFETIWSKLSEALDQVVLPENMAASCDTLGMEPGPATTPRVIIVSSISGGLGSGMTLDLAYTLRLLLNEKGLNEDELTSILLHSSYRRHRDPGLAAANAFAFMTEMRHFNDSGYAGDSGLGIPEFDNQSPFEYCYYKDIGRDLKQSELDERLNSVAEYIGLSTLSKCNVFFDACRASDAELDHFALRSFGLSVSGPGNHGLSDYAVNRLSRGLLSRWIFGKVNQESPSVEIVNSLLEKYNLNCAALMECVQRESGQFVDRASVDEAHQEVLECFSEVRPELLAHFIRDRLDKVFGRSLNNREAGIENPQCCLDMDRFVIQEGIAGGDELSAEFINLIERERLDLNLLDECVKVAQEVIGQWSMAVGQQIEEEEKLAGKLLETILQRYRKNDHSAVNQLVLEYVNRRHGEFILRYTKEFIRILSRSLNAVGNLVGQFRNHVQIVAREFPQQSDILSSDADEGFDMDSLMNEFIHSDLESQIDRTEIQVFESLIRDRGGYLEALDEAAVWQNRLPAELRNAAQRVLADAYQKLCLDKIIDQNSIAPEQVVQWLNERIASARPRVSNCGGAMRMMLGLPIYSSNERITNIIENHFSLQQKSINGTCGNFTVAFECEDISLASVAFRLLEDRPDAVELVKRIHSRSDIEWTSLADLL